jgi:hypothetical protein
MLSSRVWRDNRFKSDHILRRQEIHLPIRLTFTDLGLTDGKMFLKNSYTNEILAFKSQIQLRAMEYFFFYLYMIYEDGDVEMTSHNES